MYWQLITPGDEHLVTNPPSMAAEDAWTWPAVRWGRYPQLEQKELEAWIGATPQATPPAGTNRYLFSTFSPPADLAVRTASRKAILLVASGLALSVGLLLIYVPRLRHPAVLLLATVTALAAAVQWYPGPTVLVAQAASVGVVLALLAGLLNALLGRPRWLRSPVGAGAPSSLESRTTELHHRPSDSSARAITVGAPLPVGASELEEKP
jgi:hypothetical protein